MKTAAVCHSLCTQLNAQQCVASNFFYAFYVDHARMQFILGTATLNVFYNEKRIYLLLEIVKC